MVCSLRLQGDSLISLCLIGRALVSVSPKDENKQRRRVCEQLHKQCNLEVCKEYVGYIYIHTRILLIHPLHAVALLDLREISDLMQLNPVSFNALRALRPQTYRIWAEYFFPLDIGQL